LADVQEEKMTVKDLMLEIRRLSPEEQFMLLESITRTMWDMWRMPQRSDSSLNRVRGILKTEGKIPTDAELNNLRTQHLTEKYA
jgi:hypothetical protein